MVILNSRLLSKVYSFSSIQKMPITPETAWDFFSRPQNLQHITPASMGFVVKSRYHGELMYPGQIIEYTVRPILGIPIYWMTEITHVDPNNYFIDEQRFGPYSLWHHQHHFKKIDGGVEMTDIVHYKIPYWFVGDLANTLFVKKQLREIFAFRTEVIEKKFGKMS
jgi:ligand-binding SRPBCC domain-containing protein